MRNTERKDRKVTCESGSVEYTLTRKRVKNINLRIKPDGSVSVSAPTGVSVKYIDDFVISRYEFIKDAKEKMLSQDRKKLREPDLDSLHKNGDIFPFLGREYRLEICRAEDDSAAISEDVIRVCTFDTENPAYITKLLRNWYYNSTAEVFRRINGEVYAMYSKKYGLPPARVKIKPMRSQWGNCHIKDRLIVMNSRLIYYPEESVRYVFIHEYAHFLVPDHSAGFYDVVKGFMPDYKKWSDMLK